MEFVKTWSNRMKQCRLFRKGTQDSRSVSLLIVIVALDIILIRILD